jgi:hypothetical protein
MKYSFQQEEKRRKVDMDAGTAAVDESPTTISTCNNHLSMSDDEFCSYMSSQLQQHALAKDFPEIFSRAPQCITNWRRRFSDNPPLWRRLFDKDRVIKELIEAVPVLDAVVRLINQQQQQEEEIKTDTRQYHIIDLCSGKGYLSMLLSELLPSSKVLRIVLMDKAFPMRDQQPQAHHINWEHIYGEQPMENKKQVSTPSTTTVSSSSSSSSSSSTPSTYYETWPISLDTSKQDLKSSRQLVNIRRHYLSKEHPAIILAIHLCGTLSLRAIQLFNDNPETVHFLALKPCCLPGMVHAKRHEIFEIGGYQFDSKEVCMHGKWKQNKWVGGPPRSHILQRFQVWSRHLFCGIMDDNDNGVVRVTVQEETKAGNDNVGQPSSDTATATEHVSTNTTTTTSRKLHCRVMVQQDGGFQNDFLFAQRAPITDDIWKQLQPYQVPTMEKTPSI